MRYDVTEFEWAVIETVLPRGRPGPKRKDAANRCTVAGCARAVWPIHDGLQLLESLAKGQRLGTPDGCGDVGSRRSGADDRQLHRASSSSTPLDPKRSGDRCVGRSRGRLTAKIHARVDGQGRPAQILITPGQAHEGKKALHPQCNLVERFFNKLEQFHYIATRYDKLGDTFLIFIRLAVVRILLQSIESRP